MTKLLQNNSNLKISEGQENWKKTKKSPKRLVSIRKNQFYEKKHKNRFNGQFYHEYHLVLSLFAIIEFYDLIRTFLDVKQLFLIFPLNFPNGVFIFTLVGIGRAKSEKIVSTKPSYKFDQYMALLWPLWPLNLNRWLFSLNQLQMIPIRGKNYKFWGLDFKKLFWPF